MINCTCTVTLQTLIQIVKFKLLSSGNARTMLYRCFIYPMHRFLPSIPRGSKRTLSNKCLFLAFIADHHEQDHEYSRSFYLPLWEPVARFCVQPFSFLQLSAPCRLPNLNDRQLLVTPGVVAFSCAEPGAAD